MNVRQASRGRALAALGVILALIVPAQAAQAHPGHPPAPGVPAPPDPVYGGGWKPLAPIAGGPRQEHAVAALAGEVHLIGGGAPTDVNDAYRPRRR